jgi:DNA repair protein RecN (Recombination protein N)
LAELRDKTRELKQLGFATEEWAELQAEHHRLANGASLLAGLEACIGLLDDNEPNANAMLAQVQHKLISLVEFDPQLKEAADGVDSALIQIEEATRSLNRYLQRAELDPARLAEVENRIQATHNTARKFRVKPEELPELLENDLARMAELESFANDGALAKLEAEALTAYQASAKQLSAKRQRRQTP